MLPPPSEAAANYDVVVIGSGVGGYTAAIRAEQLGMRCEAIKRVNVEKETLGEIARCYNVIPWTISRLCA